MEDDEPTPIWLEEDSPMILVGFAIIGVSGFCMGAAVVALLWWLT